MEKATSKAGIPSLSHKNKKNEPTPDETQSRNAQKAADASNKKPNPIDDPRTLLELMNNVAHSCTSYRLNYKYGLNVQYDDLKKEHQRLGRASHVIKNVSIVWTPHLREIMCGTRDVNSPLHLFSGHESTVVHKIYQMVVEHWLDNITLTPPSYLVSNDRWGHNILQGTNRMTSIILDETPIEVAFVSCGAVTFPPPTDRNVSMMPFIMGDGHSLPEYLRPYYSQLILKCPVAREELGKVCYLTVKEGMISRGTSQNRPGLHVEAPPASDLPKNNNIGTIGGSFHQGEVSWGGGILSNDKLEGGIFMASTVSNSCAIWNALITKNDNTGGTVVVGSHGCVEHLRPYLKWGRREQLYANELVWFTDRTPHEALPAERDGYRQYFRLVTSNVSVWYAAHSTPNPLVALPDGVRVIQGNKFDSALLE